VHRPVLNNTTTNLLGKWLPAGVIVVVIAAYFGFLYQHALNVPLGDDIYDVLQVVNGVITADSPQQAFEIVYAQHNDHRTVATRLIYLGTYAIGGEINFRTLTFLANLGLLLSLALLFTATPHKPLRYLALLPTTLILFQLRAYGITLWSMAAFAYFYVFLYGFASLHCLHEVRPGKFILAILLATLATFTLASGQAVWLVGLLSLLHQALIRKTIPISYALCWVVSAAIVLIVWRIGLETPNTLWAMLAQFFKTPGHHVLYTLTLLGNAISESSVAWTALAGASMLVIVLVSTVASAGKADLRLELYCWFIVLSVAAMVLGRAPYSTVDYALSSRYSVPSVLMLACTWTLLAARLECRNRLLLLLLAVLPAGTYCISSYKIYAEALQPYVEKRVDNFNRGKYWAWTRPMKETNGIVAEAVSLGVYVPPARPLPAPTIYRAQQTNVSDQ
jgi:hypothetical protein